jgi:competence protein ComEC
VVVLSDPWALMQAGFWLSFVAVGVLFATNSGHINAAHQKHTATRLRALLKEQWVVTLALTPLTLLLFGQVSLVGLFANLLAIPWVTLVVTPLAMLGVAFSFLWDAAALSMQGLTLFLNALAGLPHATLSIAQAPVWAGAVGVLGGLLMTMRLPWSIRFLGVPMLLPVLLWQGVRPVAGEFEVLAADIGQGNAVIVRTAHHALLYDSGPRFSRESDAGHRVLVPLLRALDVKLDTVVLSHRDADHTGGAVAVLTMHAKAQLISSIEEQHELQLLRKAQRCEAGQRWRWDAVDFEILHPTASDYARNARSNAMSCVLKISNGRQSALLAGDIEKDQEAVLVASGLDLKSTLLLVPHHGSKTSSSAVFLDAVQPQIGLIQTGYRNRFGHPAETVLARYRERGVQLFDSPRCGAATWSSANPTTVTCERQQRQRYWNHQPP